jgi:hypothetical protein
MRCKTAFLVCLILSPFLAPAQLPAGSIARYPLDNAATDVSGNGYNGTLTATAATANRFATAGSATAFTSGSSTGTFPAALATALANDFSIAYWFNTTMTAPSSAQWYGGAALVDAEVCGATNDWGTALIDGGKVAMGIGNPDLTIKSTLSGYNDGAWHFVTATRNQAGGIITLYVDGAQVATTSGTNTGALNAPTLIGLGRNPCVASGVLTGNLDDAIAYNRVLSGAEVTSLYNFYNAVPLPLRWKSFNGQVIGKEAFLNWTTENSIANDHFDIEHSVNGIDFATIGSLADSGGAGIGAGGRSYQFTDNEPATGNNFYRIKQVDIDGRSSLSAIIALEVSNSSSLHIQANPLGDELALVNDGQSIVREMSIFDMSGRLIADQPCFSRNTILKMDTRELRPGYYFLRVGTASDRITLSFLKQ